MALFPSSGIFLLPLHLRPISAAMVNPPAFNERAVKGKPHFVKLHGIRRHPDPHLFYLFPTNPPSDRRSTYVSKFNSIMPRICLFLVPVVVNFDRVQLECCSIKDHALSSFQGLKLILFSMLSWNFLSLGNFVIFRYNRRFFFFFILFLFLKIRNFVLSYDKFCFFFDVSIFKKIFDQEE